MKDRVDICYLCGRKLRSSVTKDHVPPKQLFAKTIRERYPLNLFTLPVHKGCNKSYQKDEDYFVETILPVVGETPTGRALWRDARTRWARPQGKRLAKMILEQFDRRIILPGGVTSLRVDARRVQRVIWKITRGLFFKEEHRYLPKDRFSFAVSKCPSETPDPAIGYLFGFMTQAEPRGRYARIFDYKCRQLHFPDGRHVWTWGMLFCDSLITMCVFHDPTCQCRECDPRA